MKISHQSGDPRSLKLLDENAQFMTHETFARLVANIERDGVLQQWPFVWLDPDTGTRIVLSGNHRVQAAIQAGLEVIDWTECDEPLTHDERLRIQLSHNAIIGESDPATLKRLYESITDVNERSASGLSDLTLGLLDKVETSSLSEANLDFTTVTIVFLPSEYDRALRAFDDARKLVAADHRWTARMDQHGPTLNAIEDARSAAHVMNVATALDVLLDVWDDHRGDLRDVWLAGDELVVNDRDLVPVASITGLTVPAATGKTIAKAIEKMIARREASSPADALRILTDRYLTGDTGPIEPKEA